MGIVRWECQCPRMTRHDQCPYVWSSVYQCFLTRRSFDTSPVVADPLDVSCGRYSSADDDFLRGCAASGAPGEGSESAADGVVARSPAHDGSGGGVFGRRPGAGRAIQGGFILCAGAGTCVNIYDDESWDDLTPTFWKMFCDFGGLGFGES